VQEQKKRVIETNSSNLNFLVALRELAVFINAALILRREKVKWQGKGMTQ
jgi:hypothetical protein